ncbi:uncharacterized protein LOC121758437 isoform X1 [Salvia splendens]|uniref:uncharacterized protein LOC121758437 isoform X1 n=1 Tax=Salvia splendens TaxID=180675 RepID=UPI001C25E4EA|nr:uncharacterized protein LOC121758437 isoform X1 [Salvia splendens]
MEGSMKESLLDLARDEAKSSLKKKIWSEIKKGLDCSWSSYTNTIFNIWCTCSQPVFYGPHWLHTPCCLRPRLHCALLICPWHSARHGWWGGDSMWASIQRQTIREAWNLSSAIVHHLARCLCSGHTPVCVCCSGSESIRTGPQHCGHGRGCRSLVHRCRLLVWCNVRLQCLSAVSEQELRLVMLCNCLLAHARAPLVASSCEIGVWRFWRHVIHLFGFLDHEFRPTFVYGVRRMHTDVERLHGLSVQRS